MNKAGYGRKMNNDNLVYLIIIVLIGLFVLNLNRIYYFMDDLTSGRLFEKKKTTSNEVVATSSNDSKKENYEIVTPVGSLYTSCTKSFTVNQVDTKTITVYLYHSNNKLNSIKQIVEYDGYSDSYSNYLFSENNKYESLKNDNIKIKGFSVLSKMDTSNDLTASIVIDLSKASFSNIEDKNKIIKVNSAYNSDVEEVKNNLVNGGYVCE